MREKKHRLYVDSQERSLILHSRLICYDILDLGKQLQTIGMLVVLDSILNRITQNVDDLLQGHTARTMLANSEFIIMLNQASTYCIELAKLLNISDLQISYITNVGAGQGLLKVGSPLVPFVNKFQKNTELYKLMTTKFVEV